jgi:hypothetical protein
MELFLHHGANPNVTVGNTLLTNSPLARLIAVASAVPHDAEMEKLYLELLTAFIGNGASFSSEEIKETVIEDVRLNSFGEALALHLSHITRTDKSQTGSTISFPSKLESATNTPPRLSSAA